MCRLCQGQKTTKKAVAGRSGRCVCYIIEKGVMVLRRDAIYVVYGEDPQAMVFFALRKLHLAIDPSWRVGIKPNLVVAKPATSGATTSPGLVAGLVQYLQEQGVRDITIMESSGLGQDTKKAFRVSGIEEVARKYRLRLVDLKGTPAQKMNGPHYHGQVFQEALSIDYLINLPVVKAHCQTNITCALKNLKGLIPDSEKRRFHSQGLHRPIAGLNTVLKSDLVIADGIMGDLTFEEGGTPVRMDRILLAQDPVLLDAYVAELLGYQTEEIPYIGLAEELGVGSTQGDVLELNRDLGAAKEFQRDRKVARLTEKVEAHAACSVCYGALVHALERLRASGVKISAPIHIGQEFQGQTGAGIGIGRCADGFSRHVGGCPPSARAIVEFLQR